MLYLDPTWLIEVVRRIVDHTLVGTAKHGTLRMQLEKYGEEHNPPLEFDMLWAQHRQAIKIFHVKNELDLSVL